MNSFERIGQVMFDTSNNQHKLRELHNHCKHPVIPFLGRFFNFVIYSCF